MHVCLLSHTPCHAYFQFSPLPTSHNCLQSPLDFQISQRRKTITMWLLQLPTVPTASTPISPTSSNGKQHLFSCGTILYSTDSLSWIFLPLGSFPSTFKIHPFAHSHNLPASYSQCLHISWMYYLYSLPLFLTFHSKTYPCLQLL